MKENKEMEEKYIFLILNYLGFTDIKIAKQVYEIYKNNNELNVLDEIIEKNKLIKK